MRPISVCSIAYTDYERDGRVRRMCEALAADDIAIHSIALAPSGGRELGQTRAALAGVALHNIDMPRHRGAKQGYTGSYGRFALEAGLLLARLHARHRFSVIHVNTMPDFMVVAAAIPKLLGRAVLLDFHDMMPELYADKFGPQHRGAIAALRVVERLSARFANHVLAVHDLHRLRLIENGIPADKITTIMNVPDESIFRRSVSGRAEHFVLAYHGTIAPRHGVDLAVRAFARALAVNPSLRFRIVGDGDGVPAVIAAIAQERVEHAVELINRFVPVHEVPALLNDASAGIISVRSSEATEMMLPVKLLEYARLGIAVIAPRTRTIAHHFGDDAICFADPVDLDATARAILTLSADPARRRGLIERAAAIVEANGWSHQKQTYAALIRRLARP